MYLQIACVTNWGTQSWNDMTTWFNIFVQSKKYCIDHIKNDQQLTVKIWSSYITFDQVHSCFSRRKFHLGWSLLELLGPSTTTTEFYRLSGHQQLARRDFWVRACAVFVRAQTAQLPTAHLPKWPADWGSNGRAGQCCCSSSEVWGSAHLVVCVTPCVFT